jgi:NTP pyrophosphatase (non-canonical NTP hydrolase)
MDALHLNYPHHSINRGYFDKVLACKANAYATLALISLKETFMDDITLRQAQAQVDQWIQSVGVRYFSELTNLAQLMEEVGEMARIISRTYGEQSFKASDKEVSLPDEMADVLFVLICLANQTGVDLTAALTRNLEKKTQRDQDRHRNNPKLQPPLA